PVILPDRVPLLGTHNRAVGVRRVASPCGNARYAGGHIGDQKQPVKRDTARARGLTQCVALARLRKYRIDDGRVTRGDDSRSLFDEHSVYARRLLGRIRVFRQTLVFTASFERLALDIGAQHDRAWRWRKLRCEAGGKLRLAG